MKTAGQLIGGLLVDDTDLMHVNMREEEHTIDVHDRLQDAIANWGKLLIATGGALKPSKCSYYVISFKWKANGAWSCSEKHSGQELGYECAPARWEF